MTTDFGRDTWCMGTLRTGRYATGVQLVAQNLYNRFTTPRGMLRGGDAEEAWGDDLTELLGMTEEEARARVVQACANVVSGPALDERVIDLTHELTVVKDGPSVEFVLTLNAVTDEGPFELVLGVSSVGVTVLGVS